MLPQCVEGKGLVTAGATSAPGSVMYPDTNRYRGQTKSIPVTYSYQSAEANRSAFKRRRQVKAFLLLWDCNVRTGENATHACSVCSVWNAGAVAFNLKKHSTYQTHLMRCEGAEWKREHWGPMRVLLCLLHE